MRLLPSLPLLLLMILAGPAAAEISLAEVSRGSLLLPSGEAGRYQPAPLQETDALIRVTGPIARTRLRQRFSNPGDTWAEAIYAFPLPEHAAVDRLRLRVGERVIEGEIREKAQARAEYAAARAAGQRSALVEQQRPNLFTTAVANIPPHGEVSVEIEYQQTIAWRDAAFSLRLPLAITPRYTPSAPVRHSFTLGAGWSLLPGELSNAADLVPLVDGRPTTHNPVRLAIELRPGFAPERLESRFHSIEREDRDGTIHLHLSGPAPANRDFELVWAPGEAARPQGAFFTETTEAGHFGLLMLMPPRGNFPAAHRVARELIFVIDTSGSMGGASIRQARQALDLALQRLGPDDSFNVIEFNSGARALYQQPVPADAGHRAAARQFVANLSAKGGTEMLAALRLAFSQGADDPSRLRQIVFITDGAIGNEAQLFAEIQRGLGASRLFTIGIGSAPNTHFMTEAAQHGRGSATLIGRPQDIAGKMGELFAHLERPALTDLRLELPVAADTAPDPLPDLYIGEPLSIALKLDAAPDHATLRGRLGGQDWQTRLALGTGQTQAGLGVLWARRKIADLERASVRNGARDSARDSIIELALRHHLVSRHTSLVAVDRTPARPPEAALDAHALKTNLPAGWQPGTEQPIELAQGATPAPLLGLLGVLLALAGLALRRGYQ